MEAAFFIMAIMGCGDASTALSSTLLTICLIAESATIGRSWPKSLR